MRISRELIDEVVAHAREEAPNECCGLISGRDAQASAVHRVENVAENRQFSYLLHSEQQLRIMLDIERGGDDTVGIYHSHTRSEAYPSQTDVNAAKWWPDLLYVICSVSDDEPVVRAFWLRDNKVSEEPLEVEG